MVVVENVSAVKRKFSLCSRSKRGSKGEREVVNVDVIGLGSGKRASKGEGTLSREKRKKEKEGRKRERKSDGKENFLPTLEKNGSKDN